MVVDSWGELEYHWKQYHPFPHLHSCVFLRLIFILFIIFPFLPPLLLLPCFSHCFGPRLADLYLIFFNQEVKQKQGGCNEGFGPGIGVKQHLELVYGYDGEKWCNNDVNQEGGKECWARLISLFASLCRPDPMSKLKKKRLCKSYFLLQQFFFDVWALLLAWERMVGVLFLWGK